MQLATALMYIPHVGSWLQPWVNLRSKSAPAQSLVTATLCAKHDSVLLPHLHSQLLWLTWLPRDPAADPAVTEAQVRTQDFQERWDTKFGLNSPTLCSILQELIFPSPWAVEREGREVVVVSLPKASYEFPA